MKISQLLCCPPPPQGPQTEELKGAPHASSDTDVEIVDSQVIIARLVLSRRLSGLVLCPLVLEPGAAALSAGKRGTIALRASTTRKPDGSRGRKEGYIIAEVPSRNKQALYRHATYQDVWDRWKKRRIPPEMQIQPPARPPAAGTAKCIDSHAKRENKWWRENKRGRYTKRSEFITGKQLKKSTQRVCLDVLGAAAFELGFEQIVQMRQNFTRNQSRASSNTQRSHASALLFRSRYASGRRELEGQREKNTIKLAETGRERRYGLYSGGAEGGMKGQGGSRCCYGAPSPERNSPPCTRGRDNARRKAQENGGMLLASARRPVGVQNLPDCARTVALLTREPAAHSAGDSSSANIDANPGIPWTS
ncbi:hypothetical protein R3P38DRAFT_2788118 [Favolaschia claudopus]|uniref:Uncharacterized protein n=1 Tax=Favolaschia claudopus TaxID=2862362 RepID=A0AAW0ALQ0_9AGAR